MTTSNLMTCADIEREAAEHRARMARIVYYDPAADAITIRIDYPYEIEANRIRSKADLLEWMYHLAEKPWMTTEAMIAFLDLVYRLKGFRRS